jgi:putative FmdB family regulatory protein
MPTYEYQCDACAHNFDELQSFSDQPLKKCPKCGKSKLRRIIGAGAGVIFKGSGFYQTDYRSDSYKNAAKADQDSAKSSAGDKAGTDGAAGKSKETVPANGTGAKDSAKATGKRSKSGG